MNTLKEVIGGSNQPGNGTVSAPTDMRWFAEIRNSSQGYGLVAVTIDVERIGHGSDPCGYRRGFEGTTRFALAGYGINLESSVDRFVQEPTR